MPWAGSALENQVWICLGPPDCSSLFSASLLGFLLAAPQGSPAPISLLRSESWFSPEGQHVDYSLNVALCELPCVGCLYFVHIQHIL